MASYLIGVPTGELIIDDFSSMDEAIDETIRSYELEYGETAIFSIHSPECGFTQCIQGLCHNFWHVGYIDCFDCEIGICELLDCACNSDLCVHEFESAELSTEYTFNHS